MGQDVVLTAGGYEIRRVWSAEAWLYVLDDSYIGFFSQKEAEDWAREHAKMPTLLQLFPKAGQHQTALQVARSGRRARRPG